MLAVGGKPNIPPEPWPLPEGFEEATHLKETPSFEEFEKSTAAMKISAPGADEINIDMVRAASVEVREEIWQCLCELWVSGGEDGDQPAWSQMVRTGKVHMLWKGKGSRLDGNQYRGICLLSIVTRILAKIMSDRLSRHAEANGLLHPQQWGFRKGRSTRD